MSELSEYRTHTDIVTGYQGPNRRSQRPLAQLSRRFNQVCIAAVDPLQIAAALESGGITDAIARERYGLDDVFAVAEELYRSVPRRLRQKREKTPSQRWQEIRELSHGVLYALPTAVYPALAAIIGNQALFWGLLISTAVAWIWGLGMSWLVYRLIGRGFEEEAIRLLLRLSLLGILAVALLTFAVSGFGAQPGLVYLALGQMSYQMAASSLTIFRLESWLFAALAPAFLANMTYLFKLTKPEIAVAGTVASLLLAMAAAGWAIYKKPRKGFRPTLSTAEVRRSLPVFAYGALSAALVLVGNVRYFFSSPDLSLSLFPLVLGMGVLEWQSRRFQENSRALLKQTRRIADFKRKVGWLFLETLTSALSAVALMSAVLALGLAVLGIFSLPGALMLGAHLVLGGVFFTNYLLLNQGRYSWVLLGFSGAVVLYLVLTLFLNPPLSFFLTTLVLGFITLFGLSRNLGQVGHYA